MQQPGDGAIPVTGGGFRSMNGVVDIELTAGEPAERRPDPLESAVALDLMDQPEQAIAPALTIGLNGRLSAVSRIELNASPLGSTPIVASTR